MEEAFVHEAFESNSIAPLGPMVDAFEREFCERVGIPHGVALSSGTAACHLALRLVGVSPPEISSLPPASPPSGGIKQNRRRSHALDEEGADAH